MSRKTDFVPAAAAKKLLRESRSGALATLIPGSGDPYCSLVNVASAADGAPLLLISRLAVHTKNILNDARVSLMIDERREGDPLEGARLMLLGTAAPIDESGPRWRYLARQPEAEAFAGFADFALYRIAIKAAHLVAGFGRIVDLEAQEILTEIGDAGDLIEAESNLVSQVNTDQADTVRLWACKQLRGRDGPWQCVGCDPEGLELQLGRAALRLAFPERVRAPAELMAAVKQLSASARSSARE